MRAAPANLAQFLERNGATKAVVLTGAGCSTESGIPDYRGPHGRYRREDFVPLTFQQFTSTEYQKKRYWVRSMLGYGTMSGASCNPTHMGLHALARAGIVSYLLTQNVDGLHHLAYHGGRGDNSEEGYRKYVSSNYGVEEIHGNIHLVVCMSCGHVIPRAHFQRDLRATNNDLYDTYIADISRVRPDGDYNAPAELVEAMKLVNCPKCQGFLKPHVVLFGENVHVPTVKRTIESVRKASCLVCVGTSLQVFSAYRYLLAAKEAGVPIAIVNQGKTRGDDLATAKFDGATTSAIIHEAVQLLIGDNH